MTAQIIDLQKRGLKRFSRSSALLAILAWTQFSSAFAEFNTGPAPEFPNLKPTDISYGLEFKLPYLEKAYLSATPQDLNDGIPTGQLGVDGGDIDSIRKIAEAYAIEPPDEKADNLDSLLICYKGKLLFEAYYRRGRVNYPHYQMSITKSYTALAIGRAIQLGHLKMEDLDKPAIHFLKDLDTTKFPQGTDTITLTDAMKMNSGIVVADNSNIESLAKTQIAADPNGNQTSVKEKVKGQKEIQVYLESSAPIPPHPRKYKYQESDPAIIMQVLNAVTPHGSKDFIQNELFKPLGITNYQWDTATSGLPKSAAGASLLSRDMLKIGMLIMANGKWKGQQLIPEEFISRAMSPLIRGFGESYYGFYWWVDDFKVGDKTYHCLEGRGAGGQFILMFPEIDLLVVITSHDKGMGNILKTLPSKIIPAFIKN